MSPIGIGLIIVFVIFSGAVLGMEIGRRLPSSYVSSETKTVITASTAVVGTMSALMLGLLISNASNTFSARNAEVTRISADIIRVDRLLLRYGRVADPVRGALKRYTAMKLNDLFPEEPGRNANMENPATIQTLEHMQDMLLTLKPGDDRQRWLKEQALQLVAGVGETRWLLVQQHGTSIPTSVLILVVFWLTILFASFGLFAPKNLTATLALGFCALAVSGGIVIVLDMDSPFQGLVRISSASMHHTLDVISH